MPKVEKALVKAFNKILPKMRLTTADILQGKVHYLDLPWQVPPLTLDAKIGLDFAQAVFDQHLAINEKELYAFWEDSMPLLKTDPASIITRSKGYMRLVSALRMPAGERLLRFSIPEGFPHAVTDYAGVILSLECVEALRLAGLTKELHTGPSDYWAVTPEGRTFGVRNGLPLVGADLWDIPQTGLVGDILRMSRGEAFVGCDYDLISRLRCLLHYRKNYVADFEAADWLLQGLRVVAQGRTVPDLLKGVHSLKAVKRQSEARLQALQEAVLVANSPNLSDRQMLLSLKDLLVPAYLTKQSFTNSIHSYHATVPAALPQRTVKNIRDRVADLLRHEEAALAEQI